jgi:hypothetical protein
MTARYELIAESPNGGRWIAVDGLVAFRTWRWFIERWVDIEGLTND